MNVVRRRTVSIFLLAFVVGGALLHVSQMVQNAEDRLRRLEVNIQKEQESIRVLNAEWAYLNSPQRLEALSSEYLSLVAPAAGQMAPGSEVLPALPEPVQLLQRELSQEISLEQSVVRVPAPGRKPAIPQNDFNDLIGRLGGAL